MTNEQTAYTFDDIILVPQFSTLKSRNDANPTIKFWKYDLSAPIISANMETITGPDMAISMWSLGGIGALHRFQSIEQNVEDYKKVVSAGADCLVSIGVNEDARSRAEALFSAGARMFVIDIAHGHSVMMKEIVEWLREKFKEEVFIVAGNIATGYAAKELYEWGADCIKVGLGNGSICTTRVITGHGMPSFTAIKDCAYWSKNNGKLLIADGGMRSSGDIVKAIVAGADCVMIGGLISGTKEAPGDITFNDEGKKKKLYKGSSTYERGPGIAKEGIEIEIDYKGEVSSIINDLVGGIKSGMSYSNAKTIGELRKNARFKIQTMAGYLEGLPHMRGKQ